MLDEVDFIFSLNEKNIASILLRYIQSEITKLAHSLAEDPISFSSTLSFVCFNKKNNKIITFTLGDSYIYALTKNNDIYFIGRDSNYGNYCCATMTDGAEDETNVNIYDANEFSSFLICSDGAWKLISSNGLLNNKFKNYIKSANRKIIFDYFLEADNPDDCSYCFVDLVS
jgi:serine/threonine protein phosphatase PrpC